MKRLIEARQVLELHMKFRGIRWFYVIHKMGSVNGENCTKC